MKEIKISDIGDSRENFIKLLSFVCRVTRIEIVCHNEDEMTYISNSMLFKIEDREYLSTIHIYDDKVKIVIYDYYDTFDIVDYHEIYYESDDIEVISIYKEYFINRLKSLIL